MKKLSIKRSQHGAALIVGLILLVVITVLAVSGMNTATTELAMARNDQNNENAFQAAETGLEQALAQGSFNTVAPVIRPEQIINTDHVSIHTGGSVHLTEPMLDARHDGSKGTIRYANSTMVPDRAVRLGVGSGTSAYQFNAVSTAISRRIPDGVSDTDRDASAVHTQAFYKIGPESAAL